MIARLNKSNVLEFERGGFELSRMANDAEYYFSAIGLCNMAAYSRERSLCILVHDIKVTVLDIPRSRDVIGVVNTGEPDPMLVALSDDKLRVEGLRNGDWQTLFAASTPIVRAQASDAGPVIAYITEAGELGVYSCVYHAILLQIAAGTGR
jgi:hypothetical protein